MGTIKKYDSYLFLLIIWITQHNAVILQYNFTYLIIKYLILSVNYHKVNVLNGRFFRIFGARIGKVAR